MSRQYTISSIADRFHVLPSVVARDLDEDPEQLSLVAMQLLSYAEAYHAFKSAPNDDALKPWARSKMMASVKQNYFELSHARLHPELDPECAFCKKVKQ